MTPKGKFFYGYVIAASCFGIQAVGIGTYFSYGVLFNPLISEFGWSRASVAGASSVAFLLMGFLGIGIGRLNDRIGPRMLMTLTGVFFGLGYLLMSRLAAVWQLYLFFGIVFGLGLSSIDVIALSTVARWFVRKRGFVTGIVKVGTGAAGILSAIGGVSMAGRFISGIAIDRIGSKRVMLFCFILLIAALLWLQIANMLWMLYFFAAIYGLAHGGFFTTFSPVVAEFFGIKSHGALFGIAMFSGTFGGALGPFLAGYIFDITAGYVLAVWICALMAVLGLVLISLLKPVGESQTPIL